MTDHPDLVAIPDPVTQLDAAVTDRRAEQFINHAQSLAPADLSARDLFIELMRAYRIGVRDMHAHLTPREETPS